MSKTRNIQAAAVYGCKLTYNGKQKKYFFEDGLLPNNETLQRLHGLGFCVQLDLASQKSPLWLSHQNDFGHE